MSAETFKSRLSQGDEMLRMRTPTGKTEVDKSSKSPSNIQRAKHRAVNAFMTATYWEAGRRIVEFEQGERTAPSVAKA